VLQPSAADLLTQAIERMQDVTQGHAVIEIEATTPEQTASATVEMWGRLNADLEGPPAFRVEVLDASKSEAIGVIAVSDGRQFWLWRPGLNAVYVATATEIEELIAEKLSEQSYVREHSDAHEGEHADGTFPQTAEEVVARLLEYFTAERHGTSEIGGTSAYEVRLVPIAEMMPDEIRLAGGYLNAWIATGDSAPLALEYAEGAAGYVKLSATLLELDTELDNTLFEFTIPDGAEIVKLVDLAALAMAESTAPPEFETLSPTELPSGATLVDASSIRGAFVQRYSLPDGKSFTVAQGPAGVDLQLAHEGKPVTVRSYDGTLYASDDGARTMLAWSEGDVDFWVGGDISADEAFAVAESLR
jgi:outer membrane lipoprotein-sorting protein